MLVWPTWREHFDVARLTRFSKTWLPCLVHAARLFVVIPGTVGLACKMHGCAVEVVHRKGGDNVIYSRPARKVRGLAYADCTWLFWSKG
jgi:hypothetical protein